MKARLRILATLFALAAPHAVHALTGSTVNVSAFYPDSTSSYDDPGNRVVSGAIEYPTGSFPLYNTTFQIDLTEDQLILTDVLATAFPFEPAAFNGFIMEIVSGPEILWASVNPASEFAPSSLSIDPGGRLLLNYQGLLAGGPGPVSSIIDIVVVPEPYTLSLLSLGMVGLRALRRRHVAA